MHIFVIGSSGYVASKLIPLLINAGYKCTGIDLVDSEFTNIIGDAGKFCFKNINDDVIIINLAAIRFDFGVSSNEYYKKNVQATLDFLSSIEMLKIKFFIHYSSVAAIDGKSINFSPTLNCDDSYRSTKYLQQVEIEKWCYKNNIPLSVLYPSAIFDNHSRGDTNIGKLQKINNYFPFVPDIPIKKSLTFLPNLINFTKYVIEDRVVGHYMCIESPILEVSDIIFHLSRKKNKLRIKIPFLKFLLYSLSFFLFFITFGKADVKITPGRVRKLFSDTSYLAVCDIDSTLYNKYSNSNLISILKDVY